MISYKALMYISVYLVVVNIYALILMWTDKRSAESGKWRIAEKQLFLVGILGGVPGAMAGMLLFRHKTKHKRFYIGLPAILLIQWLIGIGALVYRIYYT